MIAVQKKEKPIILFDSATLKALRMFVYKSKRKRPSNSSNATNTEKKLNV